MADTPLTAAPSAAVAAPSISDAGAALKSATSWADAGIPEMAVIDDGEPIEGAPAVVDPAAPATPSAPTEAAAETAPEFVQNDKGQWHRPDGTFANAEEIAAIDAQIAADTAAEAAAKPAEPAPEVKPVTLRRRDGTTRDVVVDDPELAEEIRTNFNDGMRKKEYTEKVAAVDLRLAEFQQLDAMLTRNPESLILGSLSPEQQISIATALLAQHFDTLIPIINGYAETPGTRVAATAEAQLRMRTQEAELQAFTQSQKAAQAVRRSVESLIPETAEQAVAEQFWSDASADIQRAIARGERVDATTVPALLANRMKLYGFESPAGPPAASPPRITALAPAPTPVATPVGDAATALAAAKATQRRIQLTQRNRANAAAVPPVGAGAAPVRLPPVPKGATLEEAAKAMKSVRSWAS